MIMNYTHGNPRYGTHILNDDEVTYACGFEMPDDMEVMVSSQLPTCPDCLEIWKGEEAREKAERDGKP